MLIVSSSLVAPRRRAARRASIAPRAARSPVVGARARLRAGVAHCEPAAAPAALVVGEEDRLAADREVAALRVAVVVLGHQDPAQVGVAVEDDAEDVVDLALLEVGGREEVDAESTDGTCGVARSATRTFTRDAVDALHVEQLVVDARSAARPGGSRRRGRSRGSGSPALAQSRSQRARRGRRRVDDERRLAAVEDGVEDAGVVAVLADPVRAARGRGRQAPAVLRAAAAEHVRRSVRLRGSPPGDDLLGAVARRSARASRGRVAAGSSRCSLMIPCISASGPRRAAGDVDVDRHELVAPGRSRSC